MHTYISLLRGINISGHRKIKMIDLKALYESLGLKKVTTYIQSGNVIFESEEKDRNKLTQNIEGVIFKEYEFKIPVFIYTPNDFKKILKEQPFPQEDIKPLMVSLLDQAPDKKHLSKLEVLDTNYEQFELKENVVYLYFLNGYGKAKLSNNFLESKLKVTATTRNWRTMNKLLELATQNI